MQYFGLIFFYEPFTMGGGSHPITHEACWIPQVFPLPNSVAVLLDRDLEGVVCQHRGDEPLFTVYHVYTGGLLGEGPTMEEAIYQANQNIATTPDLEDQIEKVGPHTGKKQVSYEEAMRRLKKTKRSG